MRNNGGIGAVVPTVLPYTLVLIVGWTALYVLRHVIGVPWGPDAVIHV